MLKIYILFDQLMNDFILQQHFVNLGVELTK